MGVEWREVRLSTWSDNLLCLLKDPVCGFWSQLDAFANNSIWDNSFLRNRCTLSFLELSIKELVDWYTIFL